MTDPHHQDRPELFDPEHTLDHLGYTIHLRQTDIEWMALISRPAARPSIVLAANRDIVLAKARHWIEAHTNDYQERS